MNEITLENKVYVSSKRAAELTGYAKDYVGQLCREGRVEARLIGRNWYIRKDALEDRQLEALKKPQHNEIPLTERLSARRDADIASYQSEEIQDFPEITRLVEPRIEQAPEIPSEPTPHAPPAHPQENDQWDQWFSDGGSHAESAHAEPAPNEESTENIRANSDYEPAHQIALRRIREYEPEKDAENVPLKIEMRQQEPAQRAKMAPRRTPMQAPWIYPAIELACALLALSAILFAGIGSGFYTPPVLKNQSNTLAGVSYYSKGE
jgi:hypothetical protein